ncbi:MAG: amidohydrolase [Oscillospiraceae bacterium]|nr:amidohydrolase [Oscillospiraceae bacterium]
MKTLIKNGLVLLRDSSGWKLEYTDILITDTRITSLLLSQENVPPAGADPPSLNSPLSSLNSPFVSRIIDARNKLVMPGLINAHTHAYMTIHRNVADDLPFFDWLDAVQKIEDHMTEEDVYCTTLLAIIEMLRTGTTCFVDMTIKSAQEKSGPRSAAAGAVYDSGFRAVISRGLAGVSDSEESLMKYGQAVREMDLFRDEPRLQFMHGPHAPYSCMPDYLQKLTRSARDRGIGQTIHLSESKAEMEGMQKEHDSTPIAYVNDIGVFDVPVIAAHCVYATDGDIRLMAEKKVNIALCPKSNMKLGNGFAPAQKFLNAGLNVCLGTDGCGSNNSLNMFSEMNAAALAYKGAARSPRCVSASEVLEMATVNGAKAIGREGELGIIREGALADLILLDLNVPQFLPQNDILSGLVYSSTGTEVDTVLVNGRVLMENKHLTTIDESLVFSACENIMTRIQNSL